jgi:hypothetical protein
MIFRFGVITFFLIAHSLSSLASTDGRVRLANGEEYTLPAKFQHSKNKNIKLLIGAGAILMTSDNKDFQRWVSAVKGAGNKPQIFVGVGLSDKNGCSQSFRDEVILSREKVSAVRLQGETTEGLLFNLEITDIPYTTAEVSGGNYLRVLIKETLLGGAYYCFGGFNLSSAPRKAAYAKAKNALAATLGSPEANTAIAQARANKEKVKPNSTVSTASKNSNNASSQTPVASPAGSQNDWLDKYWAFDKRGLEVAIKEVEDKRRQREIQYQEAVNQAFKRSSALCKRVKSQGLSKQQLVNFARKHRVDMNSISVLEARVVKTASIFSCAVTLNSARGILDEFVQ